MSCFCDCSRENVKPNKILSHSTILSKRASTLGGNFDTYMSKKIAYDQPTIKEIFDEEEDFNNKRISKIGSEIRKKNPILTDITQKKQFYEFKEQLL